MLLSICWLGNLVRHLEAATLHAKSAIQVLEGRLWYGGSPSLLYCLLGQAGDLNPSLS